MPETFLKFTATGWTAISSIVAVLSVVVLGILNYLYVRAAKQQVSASFSQAKAANEAVRLATEANKIAQEAVQQQNRPWVGLDNAPDAVIVGEIATNNDGMAVASYRIKVKNYGNSPALNVLAVGSLMITEDLGDIQAEQEQLVTRPSDPNIGMLLFPNEGGAWQSASAFPSNRMKSKTFDHLFEAWFVGTIRYRDRFGNSYHTNFRYWAFDPTTNKVFRFLASPNSKWQKPFIPYGGGGSAI